MLCHTTPETERIIIETTGGSDGQRRRRLMLRFIDRVDGR